MEDPSIPFARSASAMLGPTLWKRVIVIRNASADGRYPRSLGAVVFEMGGILWFYASTDGTQSLSLKRGRAAEDERNLGPLLLQIDPGFTQWEVDLRDSGVDAGRPVPPNACFLQSVGLLRRLVSEGMAADRARLLSYYVALPTGVRGHTVLYFETADGPVIVDPLKPGRPIRIRNVRSGDARSVASCIRRDVSGARWVPIGPHDFAGIRAPIQPGESKQLSRWNASPGSSDDRVCRRW